MIRRVPADEVAGLWPEMAPLFRRGLAQTAERTSEAQLRAGLEADTLQLWADLDAPVIAVTMVSDYPNLRVLSVVLMAGHGLPTWLDSLERTLDAFGLEHGCTALEALVRPALAGARYDRSRATLTKWQAEKTLMRRPIVP